MSHLLAFAQTARRRLHGKVGGQPLSDSYGRQQLKRFGRIIQKTPNLIRAELGTQDGLTMYELSDVTDRVFVLYNGEQQKVAAYGKLENAYYRKGYKVMYNLYVDTAYRGKKLATVLHLGALHTYEKLMSDTTMSMGALSAFKSLQQHGYKLKMFDIEEGSPVPFKWGANGIPTVDGHSIEDKENYALYV